jgi:hypothetical protein
LKNEGGARFYLPRVKRLSVQVGLGFLLFFLREIDEVTGNFRLGAKGAAWRGSRQPHKNKKRLPNPIPAAQQIYKYYLFQGYIVFSDFPANWAYATYDKRNVNIRGLFRGSSDKWDIR